MEEVEKMSSNIYNEKCLHYKFMGGQNTRMVVQRVRGGGDKGVGYWYVKV